MTTSTVDRPSVASSARANAQTARAAAVSNPGGCPFCSRVGLPILPLRYAVIPKWIKDRAESVLQDHPKLDPRGPKKALQAHRYALRTLRQGYVHVYFGSPGIWQIYAVTSDGLLRLLADPDDPDGKADREMSAQCKRDGHNIPASFIRIPEPYDQKKIWVAFSQDPWSRAVRLEYEEAPAIRMQGVDCALLSKNADEHDDAFAIAPDGRQLNLLVEEYAKDEAQAQLRRKYATENKVDASLGKRQASGTNLMPSVHGFHARVGQHRAIGQFVETYSSQAAKRKAPGGVAALVLCDPVGIAQEVNYTRLQAVQWRADYVGNLAVSRPKLISQAIMGLKTIYEQSALVAVARENGVLVVDSLESAQKPEHRGKTVVAVDKLPEFAKKTTVEIEGIPDPATGMPTPSYTMQMSEVAGVRAKGQWARLQRRYDEKKRAEFDKRYNDQMAAFQSDLNALGADYDIWARHSAWMQWFSDYDSKNNEEAMRLTQLAAPILSGGPTDIQSHALWKRWLGHLAPNDPSNPVYAAYFGGRKDVVDYLVPKSLPKDFMSPSGQMVKGFADPQNPSDPVPAVEKGDKLYDTLKVLAASDQGEKVQHAVVSGAKGAIAIPRATLMQSAAYQAALAHIQSAVSAATALLAHKLTSAQHAVALRAHQAALHLYKGVETVFVKVTLTLGEYLKALKTAGFDAAQAAKQALTQGVAEFKDKSGRKVRALALAGMLNLNDPKLQKLMIEVTVWVAAKGNEFGRFFKNLGGDVKAVAQSGGKLASAATQVAAGRLRIAGITLSHEAAQLAWKGIHGAAITADEAGILARKLIGWGARIGGSKEVLLAGAALGFQSWAFLDASNQLKEKIGPEKAEAALAIVSAQIGMTAAVVEVFGAAFKALGASWGKLVLTGAGLVAAGASVVDAVSAGLSSYRMGRKGDLDAAVLYGLAGAAFFGAAIVGGYATLIGASSLFGPVGIALLLVVVGVGLMFAALLAEDTAAEIWLDRCVWGFGSRKENGKSAKWSDADHATELAEMNSLLLGAKAEIGFNDDMWAEMRTGLDTVSMKVTLPNYDPAGSAFILVASAHTARNPAESHLLYYEVQGKPVPPDIPKKVSEMNLAWLNKKGSDVVNDRVREITQHFRVNTQAYKSVRISLDYWPDASDELAILSIRRLEND